MGEDGGGGDGVGDGGEVMDGLADVLRYEVAWNALAQCVEGARTAVGGLHECLVVACVGHNHVGRGLGGHGVGERINQRCDVAGFCGDFDVASSVG